MNSIENLQTIIIGVYLVTLFIALFIALSIYGEYITLKKGEDDSRGSWVGGTFYANPEIVIPINDKTENKELQKVIDRHKKAVLFFWIWLGVVLPSLITISAL